MSDCNAYATLAYGQALPWARLCIETLRRVTTLPILLFVFTQQTPLLGATHKIVLDVNEINSVVDPPIRFGVCDFAKARMYTHAAHLGFTSLFYLDADCVPLACPDEVFATPGLLAMTKMNNSRHPFFRFCNLQGTRGTYNAGALLMRRSYCTEWKHTFQSASKWCNHTNRRRYVMGETIWNVVYHKAENTTPLPKRYNYIHHRALPIPTDVSILHLAGTIQPKKRSIMEEIAARTHTHARHLEEGGCGKSG